TEILVFVLLCGFWAIFTSDVRGELFFDEQFRLAVSNVTDVESPAFIGTRATSVAWNGTSIFVGGQNELDQVGSVGVAQLNPIASPMDALSSPRLITSYDEVSTGFGISSLDLHGNSIAVSYEDGFAQANGSVAAFDIVDGSQRWSVNSPGAIGVSFDPGQGHLQGNGVSFASPGARRLSRLDSESGEVLRDQTNGMLWNHSDVVGDINDVDFNRRTGDVHVRHNGQIMTGTRVSPDDVDPVRYIAGQVATGDHLNLEPLLVFSTDVLYDGILYNVPQADSTWHESIRLVEANGVFSESINFRFLGNDIPAAGSGDFDFAYDHDSRQLAVLDISNQSVHVFSYLERLFPDANRDEVLDCADIDRLTREVASGTNDIAFDGNRDGEVNFEDLALWRRIKAIRDGYNTAYLQADLNFDRVVDISDFNIWNANRFQETFAFCSGDINADGLTDLSDFALWNQQKFTSAAGTVGVPEPNGATTGIWMIGILLLLANRRRLRR
ncbi:MAG: hypothetical protein AAF497_04755, partial [Planctomycetota bacterium]